MTPRQLWQVLVDTLLPHRGSAVPSPGPVPPPRREHRLTAPGRPELVVWWSPELEGFLAGQAPADGGEPSAAIGWGHRAPDGTTTGFITSVEALAAAIAPYPLPGRVREALAADRAARPPIADAWRRRIDAVERLLAAHLPPEARPVVTLYTPPMVGGPAHADPHPVLVQVRDDHHAAAAEVLYGAGYPLLAPPAEGIIIIAKAETEESSC